MRGTGEKSGPEIQVEDSQLGRWFSVGCGIYAQRIEYTWRAELSNYPQELHKAIFTGQFFCNPLVGNIRGCLQVVLEPNSTGTSPQKAKLSYLDSTPGHGVQKPGQACKII